jgi:hypothetical protein
MLPAAISRSPVCQFGGGLERPGVVAVDGSELELEAHRMLRFRGRTANEP